MHIVYPQDITCEYKEHRNCYAQLDAFIKNDNYRYICALYGLRRTGKTVLMEQYLSSMSDEDKVCSAMIICTEGHDMLDLDTILNNLCNKGIKNVFIDEITMLDDFPTNTHILSDYYSTNKKMKIVIAGTDSLGIAFAGKEPLYNRMVKIHTSYVSFPEYSRLLGKNDIREYLRYGGTLTDTTYKDNQSADEYINTAIAGNIIRSLKKSENGRSIWPKLTQIHSDEEIISAINKVIDRFSQDISLNYLYRKYKSGVLSGTEELFLKKALGENRINYRADKYEKEQVLTHLKKVLCITDNTATFKNEHFEELKGYLKELGLITEITTAGRNLEIINQWGMSYCHVEETLKKLFENQVWKESATIPERLDFMKKADEYISGRLLENIVLAESSHAFPEDSPVMVTKYDCEINGKWHEADMVLVDKDTGRCYLFEIKLTESADEQQKKHLGCEEFIQKIGSVIGPVDGKAVLYRGEDIPADKDGICYINVNKFLNTLELSDAREVIENYLHEQLSKTIHRA